jgi:hypothetical protein
MLPHANTELTYLSYSYFYKCLLNFYEEYFIITTLVLYPVRLNTNILINYKKLVVYVITMHQHSKIPTHSDTAYWGPQAYALCTPFPCIPWQFQWQTHALIDLCISTLCIMRTSTVFTWCNDSTISKYLERLCKQPYRTYGHMKAEVHNMRQSKL